MNREENGGFAPLFALNGAVACVFFLVSAGFSLKLDLTGFLFSLAFALTVALSLFSNMRVLRFMDVAQVTLISSSFYVIVTVILGFVLFSEPFSWLKLLRVGLVTAAFVLIFIARRDTLRSEPGFLPSLVLTAVSLVAAFLVQKYFTLAETLTDNNSFCFFTNLILLSAALPFAVKRLSGGKFRLGAPTTVLVYCLHTVSSNVGSLLGLLLIASTDVAFYTPFTSAAGIICGVAASFVFREKLSAASFIAVLLAVAAVFV